MIDGLKLTFSGRDLRALLDERIAHHRQRSDWWTREKSRTQDDETEDAPVLPEHICEHEAECRAWRAEVLQFIRDHVEVAETYRLSPYDLDFGDLLPLKPGWLDQEEYEERSGVAFALERAVKAVDRLATAAQYLRVHRCEGEAATAAPEIIPESDEFKATRVDTDGGPEMILVKRNK